MSAYLRFHRNQNVDCYVPSSLGIEPSAPPSDVLWELSADINPSKTIQVTQNVQATDPITGQLLFNSDGSPQWKTTNALDGNGKPIPVIDPSTGKPEVDAKGNPVYQQQIVTAQVNETVYLQSAPQYFTPVDIEAACQSAGVTFNVVGSLAQAQSNKIAELEVAYEAALSAGFTSAADGTSRTYGYAQADRDHFTEATAAMNAGIATWPIEWADINGNPVSLTQAQYTQLIKDAESFEWNQVNNLRTKCGQAKSTPTVSAVNAITY